jgi:hypothetical protein
MEEMRVSDVLGDLRHMHMIRSAMNNTDVDSLYSRAADEIERLRADVDRQMAIATEHVNECDRLREYNDWLKRTTDSAYSEKEYAYADVLRLRAALERIAGGDEHGWAYGRDLQYIARAALDTNAPANRIAEPASAPLTPFAEDAHTLAVLAIQSDRYGSDPEFRDAVDNVLNQTKRAAFQTDAPR